MRQNPERFTEDRVVEFRNKPAPPAITVPFDANSQLTPRSCVVGIVREVLRFEYRVGIPPCAAGEFVRHGHTVLVESGAGVNSGFSDESYVEAGCKIMPTAAEVWKDAQLVVKVKEPHPEEYSLITSQHTVFTFFHFAASKALTDAMIESGATCIAYETIYKDGQLPVLIPMSEIAGKMAVQEGAKYLEKPMGGSGILLGGVPGVLPARVTILGGGAVGTAAARLAAGFGADVTLLDINVSRLRYLNESILPPNARTMFFTPQNLISVLPDTDLFIGAVLVAGARSPRLLTRSHLGLMKTGAVVVDVAVDQGGCVETSRPTTLDTPTFTVDGVLHYCVANMPGAVPRTSTVALSNATMRYALSLADCGWAAACAVHPELAYGLSILNGKIVHPQVAASFGLECCDVEG